MIASTAAFIGLAFTKPQSQRIFHYITAAITMIASIAYFSMGSNLGWTGIQVEFLRSDPKVAGNVRQIFYVRYIDWFCTTPLLLLDLMLTAGFSSPTILYTILINEIMVVTGLIGALVRSSYKWGYFTFGCAAFLFVAYAIVFEGRSVSSYQSCLAGTCLQFCSTLALLVKISTRSSPSAVAGPLVCGSSTPSPGVSVREPTSFPLTLRLSSTASLTSSPSQSLVLSSCGDIATSTSTVSASTSETRRTPRSQRLREPRRTVLISITTTVLPMALLLGLMSHRRSKHF